MRTPINRKSGMDEGEWEFGVDSEDFQDKDQRKLFLNLSSPSSLSMQKTAFEFQEPISLFAYQPNSRTSCISMRIRHGASKFHKPDSKWVYLIKKRLSL